MPDQFRQPESRGLSCGPPPNITETLQMPDQFRQPESRGLSCGPPPNITETLQMPDQFRQPESRGIIKPGLRKPPLGRKSYGLLSGTTTRFPKSQVLAYANGAST